MPPPVAPSARTDPGAAVAGLRRLRGGEIRRLVVGRTLSFVAEPGVPTSPHQEVFRADGTLFVRGDRAGAAGTYRIAEDRLCVSLGSASEAPEECRSLFRAADGRHYLVIPRREPGGGRPIRISIED